MRYEHFESNRGLDVRCFRLWVPPDYRLEPIQEMGGGEMIVSDWYDDLDDVLGETVDEMFGRLRQAEVVSLDHYRKVSVEYKAWKPLSLEDYAFKLRATQLQMVIKGLEDSRKVINDRVKRQNRLTTPKKD